MSGTVDTRTVEMRFDNKNFESNVKQSMSTLDKLKQKLKLDGATKGLKEVENSSKKLDFKDANKSIGKLGKSFSALETIAEGALLRIGMKVEDAGERMVKSLSIDQVVSGWNKYAEKTTAVQTIMSNLKDDASKFTDEVSKMDYVNRYLEKLMWFSDETSYNFTDMTGNVGKFIANGQDLEESVTAMQGIATWAAMSGQNAQTASRAMYNIAQAMGTGSMKIKDWMSIENANMATAQFKELAITVGQKKGKIKEGQVTIESFRESLSGKDTNGWFDKEVMMEVFETYGEAADRIQSYAKAHNITSTEAIREIKKQDAAFADSIGFKAFAAAQEAKTFKEVIEATADAASTKWLQFFENIFGNYEQAKKLWTDLSEDLYDIFVEPLNGLNEIMSAWNTGFFGDKPLNAVDKAFEKGLLDTLDSPLKQVTKEFAEQTVAADSDAYSIKTLADGTQYLMKKSKKFGKEYDEVVSKIYKADDKLLSGRTMLIDSFKNLLDTFFHDTEDEKGNEVLSILGTIKRAFQEVFFPNENSMTIGKMLWNLTKRFKEFTEKIKPSQETIEKIKNSFKGLFTIFKITGKFIGAIIKPFKELFTKIFGAKPGQGLLNSLDGISNWLQKLDKSLDENGIFDTISQGITNGIQKIKNAFDAVSKAFTGLSLSDLFLKIKTSITGFFTDYDFENKFEKIGSLFRGSVDEINQVETGELPEKLTPLQNFWIGLKGILQGLKSVLSFIFEKVIPFLAEAFGKIGSFIGNLFGGLSSKKVEKDSDSASSVVEEAGEKLEKSAEKINPVINFLSKVFQGVKDFFAKASPFFDKIGDWISRALGKLGEFLGKFAENNDLGETIKSFAEGGFFVALILLIRVIKNLIKEFKGIGGAVKGIFSGLSGIFNNVSGLISDARQRIAKKNKLNSFRSIAISILLIAGALFIVAEAFNVFAKIEFENTSVEIISLIFLAFIGISVAVAMASKKMFKEKADIKALYSMVAFMIGVAAVLKSLTNTFKLFADIKFENTSAKTIGIIFAAFIGISTLVAWAATKFIKDEKSIQSLDAMAGFMQDVATALVPLSVAMWIAGRASADPSSVTTIGIIFGAFILLTAIVAVASTKFLENRKNAEKTLPMMSAFMQNVALALIPLSAALWIIGQANLDPTVATTAGIIFGAFILLTAIVAVASTKFLENQKNAEKALPLMSAFMIAASSALVILAAAFKLISMIDFEKTPVGTISLIFAVFMALSAGLAVVGGVIMKNGASIAGIAMMAGFMLTAAVSLAIVAYAFGQMASNISPSEMSAALDVMITFAAIVAILAVIGTVLAGTGVGVVGMALVAAIIIAIGAACLMAGAGIALMVTSVSNLISTLSELMVIIATYGPEFAENVETVVSAILDTVINLAPKMRTAAIVVIKTIAEALIEAAPIVSKALVILLIYLMQNVRETLNTSMPILVMTIIDAIDTLANVLRDSAPLLTSAIRNLVEAIIETVIVSIAGIIEPFGEVGSWIAEKITGWIPGLREAFKVAEDTDSVLNHIGETPDVDVGISVGDENAAAEQGSADGNAYVEAFRNATEDSVEKGDLVGDLLSKYGMDSGISGTDTGDAFDINSLLGGSDDSSMFSDVMTGKMGDMTAAIEEETPHTRAASEQMAQAIEDPITALDSRKWGADIGISISNGLFSKLGAIQTAANATAQVIHDILGFSEPKKGPLSDFHTYAPDMIKLWCSGIKDNLGSVDKSTTSVSSRVESGFSTALDYVSGLIDGGMSEEPSIRPILDLSEIQNGTKLLDSMLSSRSTYPLYGTSSITSSAAYDMRQSGYTPNAAAQVANNAGDIHNTFNISSNDPNAVAQAVSKIINQQVRRKQAVWAK